MIQPFFSLFQTKMNTFSVSSSSRDLGLLIPRSVSGKVLLKRLNPSLGVGVKSRVGNCVVLERLIGFDQCANEILDLDSQFFNRMTVCIKLLFLSLLTQRANA